MNDARSPEDWGDAYADLEPMYGRFGERLEELLRSLLQDEEISYIESYSWTKESEFFVDEIYVRAREGQPVDDPLDSFDDLVGVTITTHTKTESESICRTRRARVRSRHPRVALVHGGGGEQHEPRCRRPPRAGVLRPSADRGVADGRAQGAS